MNIYEALKLPDRDVRVSAGPNRWLTWDNDQWIVREKKPYQRNARCLYSGDSADEAIATLVGEE